MTLTLPHPPSRPRPFFASYATYIDRPSFPHTAFYHAQLRENLRKLSSQIAVKQSTYDELEEKIAKLVKDNKTFFNQASKYQDIIGKVDTLREKRNLHEVNLQGLLEGLKELPGALRIPFCPSSCD